MTAPLNLSIFPSDYQSWKRSGPNRSGAFSRPFWGRFFYDLSSGVTGPGWAAPIFGAAPLHENTCARSFGAMAGKEARMASTQEDIMAVMTQEVGRPDIFGHNRAGRYVAGFWKMARYRNGGGLKKGCRRAERILVWREGE